MDFSITRHTAMLRASLLSLLLALGISQVPLHAQSQQGAATPDPLGEWYLLGHRMAQEALPTYREFEIKNAAISSRLAEVLAALGVQPTSLKASQFNMLQQGWDDAALGKPPALTYQPEQPKSLLPNALRGYHKFKTAPGTADSPGTTLADKAALWKKAVVKVIDVDEKGDPTGHGSGCFIGPGLVLTNNHVVQGASAIAVQLESDKTFHPATVLATQKVPDVALLRVDLKDHEIVPIGSSADCRELEEVIMIGYPIFIEKSATYVKGAISSTDRVYKENQVLQLDIRANHGNSGGPVITTDGRIIGILTFGLGGINVELSQFTYAIKTDFLHPFLEQNARGMYEKSD